MLKRLRVMVNTVLFAKAQANKFFKRVTTQHF